MTIVAFTEAGALPPGAFMPALMFTDTDGKPCEGVTIHAPTNAPIAVFEVPQDGTYALEVKATADEAGDACVYRIKLGELPLITALSPAGAQEGESLNVRLEGFNLPRKRVRLFTGGKNSALCLQTLTEGAYVLPSLRFDLAAEAAAPDFRVTMTPASLNIPADGSALVTLHVERLNGFNGAIKAALDFPPLGVTSEGGIIPPGASVGWMTVSTDSARFPRTIFGLSPIATAEINGQTVKRAILPARGDREQAFQELAARANAALPAMRLSMARQKQVTVQTGAPVNLTVLGASVVSRLGDVYEPIVVCPPHGFSVQNVLRTNTQERATVVLKADSKVLKPGATGQLILGCVRKDDKQRKLVAVSQSVLFNVK